jgi:hypothetical protein
MARNRPLPTGVATTARVRGAPISVTDGPYAETKELLGVNSAPAVAEPVIQTARPDMNGAIPARRSSGIGSAR